MTAIKVKTASGWQDLSILPGSVPIEPWHVVGAAGEPFLGSGWTHLGAPYNNVGFRKTPDGRVQLRGVAVPAAGAAAIAFTLPVGYRPAATMFVPALGFKSANGHLTVNCSIGTDGFVQPSANQAAGAVAFPWGWCSFEGVEFPTDQATFPTGPPGQATRVTSLPATPADGQEVYYVADAANGVLWHLRYNAASASAYKWEFVGGSPLATERLPEETAASFPATTWGGFVNDPVIAVPLAGDYDGDVRSRVINLTSACSWQIGFRVGTLDPVINVTAMGIAQAAAAANAVGAYGRRLTGLTAGVNVFPRYWHNGTNPSSCNRNAALLRLTPVRVG